MRFYLTSIRNWHVKMGESTEIGSLPTMGATGRLGKNARTKDRFVRGVVI